MSESGPRLVVAAPIEVRAQTLAGDAGQALHGDGMSGRHVAFALPVGHGLLGQRLFASN